MCKLAKYVRNCVVFWKIYTDDKNFTRPPVATVATNSKSAQICFTYPQCNVELQKYFLKSFSPHATSLLNLSHKSPVRVQQEGGVLPFLDHLWSNHAGSQVLCLHLFSSQFQFLVLNFEATLPTTGILSFNTNLEMSSWTRTSSLHYGSAYGNRKRRQRISNFTFRIHGFDQNRCR